MQLAWYLRVIIINSITCISFINKDVDEKHVEEMHIQVDFHCFYALFVPFFQLQ